MRAQNEAAMRAAARMAPSTGLPRPVFACPGRFLHLRSCGARRSAPGRVDGVLGDELPDGLSEVLHLGAEQVPKREHCEDAPFRVDDREVLDVVTAHELEDGRTVRVLAYRGDVRLH